MNQHVVLFFSMTFIPLNDKFALIHLYKLSGNFSHVSNQQRIILKAASCVGVVSTYICVFKHPCLHTFLLLSCIKLKKQQVISIIFAVVAMFTL